AARSSTGSSTAWTRPATTGSTGPPWSRPGDARRASATATRGRSGRARGRGPARVTDAFHPAAFPPTARLSPRVVRVLGLNPGLMTGPGTNTYAVGLRRPVLIDTGAGVPEYGPLLAGALRAEGLGEVQQVLLTHRHADHMGGVPDVRRLFPR